MTYSLQAPQKEFWQKLDISVEDALEFEKPKKKPWLTLYNLMKKSNGWFDVISNEEGKKKDFKTYFKHLFKNNKINFYRLYFLCQFASKVDNIAIKDRLPESILTKYQKELDSGAYSYESMLYPTYQLNKNLLESILYDSLINKSSIRSFEFNEKDISEFVKKLNDASIKSYFDNLKKGGKLRTNFKIWWFERKNGKIKILVRTESKHRRSIHQVAKNTFLKTAGDKIIVISEDGKRLEVLAKESIRVANWINQIATEVTGFEVKFNPIPNQYNSKSIFDFIIDVKDGKFSKITLDGIEVKNTPLTNSPIISLDSITLDSISVPLDELKNQHGLNILNSIEDIEFVTITIEGKTYKISLSTENGITTTTFDNKNLHEKDKNRFYEILNSHVSGA